MEGLFYGMTPADTRITLDNRAGTVVPLPLSGQVHAFLSMKGGNRVAVDLTHPSFATTGRFHADFLERHATRESEVTISYHGIALTQRIAGRVGVSNSSRVLEVVQQHF